MPRLYEYQGKELFSKGGIRVPKGRLAANPEESRRIAEDLGKPVVVKAQVLTGGRGRAGAIRVAENPDDAERASKELIGSKLGGIPVEKVLVEEKVPIKREYYMSVTSDPDERNPICIVSSRGGVEIEEVAREHPESIVRQNVNILDGLKDYDARNVIRKLPDVSNAEIVGLGNVLAHLYAIYRQYDCRLAEINPLVMAEDDRLILAVDARVEIDDDAIFRHPELGLRRVEELGRPETLLEVAAGRIDEGDYRGTAHFVQIDPDGSYSKKLGKIPVGFDCVGAGASLTGLDELADLGYMPVNFADTSGNPTGSKLYRMTKVILSQPGIQGYVFMTCMSSQQLDNTARGVVKALKELYPKTGGKPNIPMVLHFRGSWDEDAHRLFREHGIAASPWVSLVGRDSTEKDAAQAFHELYQKWKKNTGRV